MATDIGEAIIDGGGGSLRSRASKDPVAGWSPGQLTPCCAQRVCVSSLSLSPLPFVLQVREQHMDNIIKREEEFKLKQQCATMIQTAWRGRTGRKLYKLVREP